MEEQPPNDKFSAAQVADALRKAHGNASGAARLLRCERNTVARYINNYPTVKAAHDEASAAVSDIAEGHLVRDVIKGNWDQVRYWLEAKARDRGYGKAAPAGVNIAATVKELMDMEPDDLDKFIAHLSKLGG